MISSYIKASANKVGEAYPRDVNTVPTEEDFNAIWDYGNAPLPYLSLKLPGFVKEWAYAFEGLFVPYADTLLFAIDIFPTLVLCNLLAALLYNQYDEVAVELQCLNRAFTGFKLLWNLDA